MQSDFVERFFMDDFLYINKQLKNKSNNNIILNQDDAKKEVKESLDNIDYLLNLVDSGLKSTEVLNTNVLKLLKFNYQNILNYFSKQVNNDN